MIGYYRKVDNLGRVVVPKEIRFKLNIKYNDLLEFALGSNGNIMIKKAKPFCALCHSEDKLKSVGDNYICDRCTDVLISGVC